MTKDLFVAIAISLVVMSTCYSRGTDNNNPNTTQESNGNMPSQQNKIKGLEDEKFKVTNVKLVGQEAVGYLGLRFGTFDDNNFECPLDKINVIYDPSHAGTFIKVDGVSSPKVRESIDPEHPENMTFWWRYVDSATLYVSTNANKLSWDDYLIQKQGEILKMKLRIETEMQNAINEQKRQMYQKITPPK